MIVSTLLPIVAVLLCGAASVMLVGIVGGPIKIETPIVLTVLHLIAFVFWASGWSRGFFFGYVGLLVSCGVVQAVVAVDLFKDDKRVPDRMARAWLAAAYAGLVALVLLR